MKISREIMASTDVQPGDVKGIVFATQGAGVIPIGKENGEVIDPAIIWMDGRAQDEANEIMEMFGGKDAFAELTGVQLMGKDVLPKVRWLYKHKPDMFAKWIVSWMSPVTLSIWQQGKRPTTSQALRRFAMTLKLTA